MDLLRGTRICIVDSRGQVQRVHVQRVERTRSELIGGRVRLIHYAPAELEAFTGTVLSTEQGITWDLGWEEETVQALSAASALVSEMNGLEDLELVMVSDVDGISFKPRGAQ